MKKLWFLLLIPVLGLGAYLAYQNLPSKRYARHVVKARLYANEGNLTAAQQEYETAYNISGKFTPWASIEVLRLMNTKALQEKNLAEALSNTRKFVEAVPTNQEGRLTLSQLAFQSGDLETAFQNVNALLEADPGYFPGRLLLTQVRTRQGRLDLAEEQLRYLYGKYPDSLEALLPLAENLLKQGKPEESRQILMDALAKSPKQSNAHMLLVDSYLAERKIDSAKSALDAWQKQAPAEMARPLAVRRARFEALAGRYQAVDSIFAPYRELKEENVQVLTELATMQAAQGKYDSAIQLYESLADAVPKMQAGCLRMTLLLNLKSGNPAKALENAKILQLGSRNSELLPFTLAAYQGLGQVQKADELIAKQPDSVQASLKAMMAQWAPEKEFIGQWALVEFFRLNGQAYQVLAASQALYKQWPQNVMAASLFASQLAAIRQFGVAAQVLEGLKQASKPQRMTLLALYARAGQRDKTIALASALLKEDPKQQGLNLLLADEAMAKKDKAKAMEFYERELALNPDNLVALNNLAWEFGVEQADFPKAQPYLDKLKARKVLDSRILDTIGWILAKNGKGPEAEKFIREALNLAPDHPSYLFHMGWIQFQAGKKEEAKKYFQSALTSKIPFAERKEVEVLLAQQG